MSFPFNPGARVILVRAEILGPARPAVVQLALDTGATRTMISTGALVGMGYNLASAQAQAHVTTASGTAYAPLIDLIRITSLGQTRTSFRVTAHSLPPSANVDGLLGLDFFRGLELKLDFRKGLIDLH